MILSLGYLFLVTDTEVFPYTKDFFHSFTLEEQAQIGDSFNVLNSIFSGLAMAGVFIAIFIQDKELKSMQKIQERDIFENRFFEMLAQFDEKKDQYSLNKILRYFTLQKENNFKLDRYYPFVFIVEKDLILYVFNRANSPTSKQVLKEGMFLKNLTFQMLFDEHSKNNKLLNLLKFKREAYGDSEVIELYDWLEKGESLEDFFTEEKATEHKIIVRKKNLEEFPNLKDLFERQLKKTN
jgi:hypothetical protein